MEMVIGFVLGSLLSSCLGLLVCYWLLRWNASLQARIVDMGLSLQNALLDLRTNAVLEFVTEDDTELGDE